MDNPFYIIPTLSRTADITNPYVQKRKRKFTKVRFPLNYKKKKKISCKKLMLSIFLDILLSHYLYVFFHIIGNRFNICTYDNLYTCVT
ncbi:hypothetical protein COC60_11620 [Bacillus thuringiensis]|uniref:Uncharacterized protein n=1 Tax=Bacillus cereus TaxID=1396 RepID=A0A9W7Q4X4_BACCE|nr:hypothetical protein DOS87_02730 [Bacillus sp. CR71]AXR20837.1 hypothetical protein DPQ26_02755 [Bacillus sp. E25]KAA6467137.1 hypothetical protein DX932_13430 [Bacillus cereus]PFQ83310.1 hypothetical protein COK26_12560 [Bacillus thuringiensis]KAB2466972.1 hypothetical protein F8161_00715 [Bacillus cereus]